MSFVIGAAIGVLIAFALLLGYLRVVDWAKETRTSRFSFEDRDTYLFLKLDRPLDSGPTGLMSMQALREALKLKLMGVGYERVLVDVSTLHIANHRAFWLLIGALAPALGNEKIKLAVVCGRRSPAGKRFRESAIVTPFVTLREAENYLRSAEPRARVLLDPEQLDSLLAPGRSRAA